MKNIFKYIFVLLFVAGISMGCDGFLSPSVDQQKDRNDAVKTTVDLRYLVNGIHDGLNNANLYGSGIPIGLEVMSDNAWSNGRTGRFVAEGQMNFTVTTGVASDKWNNLYGAIADANVVINSSLPSSPEVDYIKGQAYALRAFMHMDLLMYFGQQFVNGGNPSLGIPYVTTYNEGNYYPPRDPIATVWENINSDFESAVNLMDPSLDEAPELINYWAVRALQTRSYLYQGNYNSVIPIAEDIISNSGYSIASADSYVSIWNDDSGPGSMFEMANSDSDNPGLTCLARMYRDTNYGDVEVTEGLYNTYDANDVRLGLYSAIDEDPEDGRPLNYRMVGKFPNELGYDNVPIIRYAEVILTYAEALAETGNQAGALIQINQIASNRNAPLYTSGSVENVWNERRLELAMEGHRFFDLIRTGRSIQVVDPNQTIIGGGVSAGSYRFALPIPQSELDANSSMVQNQGYE